MVDWRKSCAVCQTWLVLILAFKDLIVVSYVLMSTWLSPQIRQPSLSHILPSYAPHAFTNLISSWDSSYVYLVTRIGLPSLDPGSDHHCPKSRCVVYSSIASKLLVLLRERLSKMARQGSLKSKPISSDSFRLILLVSKMNETQFSFYFVTRLRYEKLLLAER